MKNSETVKIFVPLLEEGTPALRPTQGIPLGGDLYEVLPTPDYDPEDEIWEFLPGTVVRCDTIKSAMSGQMLLRAREGRMPDGNFLLSEDLRGK